MESPARINEFKYDFERLGREYPADPKIVYLASSYRSARGEFGVEQNIAEARTVARALWKLGLAVICPVMNTSMFGGSDIPDEVWLKGDFAMIKRCDGIVMHDNSDTSSGAQLERKVALESGVRVFRQEDWRKIAHWAKERRVDSA